MAEKNCSIEGCNGQHAAKGYCSKHYMQSRRGNIKPDKPDATVCAHCGAPFKPENNAAMYCSKKCKVSAWIKANPDKHQQHRQHAKDNISKKRITGFAGQYCKVHAGHCLQCSKAFVSNKAKKFCSSECLYLSQALRIRLSNSLKKDISPKICKECGSSFIAEYGDCRRSFCTDSCSIKHARRSRRIKYGKTSRKRARFYGVSYEPVNRIKVFDRDGWRCQICGKNTPIMRMGSMATNAPELDHRVPISKGGGHLYSNTQCLCRSCNGIKSNHNEAGQLPMFIVC